MPILADISNANVNMAIPAGKIIQKMQFTHDLNPSKLFHVVKASLHGHTSSQSKWTNKESEMDYETTLKPLTYQPVYEGVDTILIGRIICYILSTQYFPAQWTLLQ